MMPTRHVGSRYVLHERLGRGATGEVWRATTRDTDDAVAVKILRGELADDPQIVERFVRERSLLLGFHDRHLVKVRDLVVEGDTLAIVMDFVAGGDLRRHLRASGHLMPPAAVGIVRQVLLALSAVHAAGIVHRDVKPENILVDPEQATAGVPRALLTDFGIARLAHGPAMTRLTGIIGTPLYMAPELAGRVTAGPPADVYATGVVLYELLAGHPPFEAPNPVALLRAHMEDEPEPLRDLPDGLWAALARMLAKEPGDRPQTGSDAERMLDVAMDGGTLITPHPPEPLATTADDGETRLSPVGPLPRPVPPLDAAKAADDTVVRTPAPIVVPLPTPTPTADDPDLTDLGVGSGSGEGPGAGGPTGAAGSGGRRRKLAIMGSAAVVLAAGVGVWGLVNALGDSGTDPTSVSAPPAATSSTRSSPSARPSARRSAKPSAPPSSAPATVGSTTPGGQVPAPVAQASVAQVPVRQAPPAPADDGLRAVPSVMSMTLADATSTLKGRGFTNIPYLYECYRSANIGTVVAQSPGAGTRIAPTSPVRLNLQANNCVTVPNVVGMNLDDASYTLKQLGFTNIPYLYQCYGSTQIGAVVRQTPASGTSYGTTQPVNIYLQANNCT